MHTQTAIILLLLALVFCTLLATTKILSRWSRYFSLSSHSTYEAPYLYTGPAELIVPESYIIYLRAGYMLKDHSTVIGTDIEQYISYIPNSLHEGGLVYYCDGVSDELFAKIRADRGVVLVQPNHEPYPVDSC
jgi:hypothetical protein